MPSEEAGALGIPELTAFQLEVVQLFFALAESKGFLLAGGAALLAQRLTTRSTEDLDFFTDPEHGHVPAARDALEAAVRERGWSAERPSDFVGRIRLMLCSFAGPAPAALERSYMREPESLGLVRDSFFGARLIDYQVREPGDIYLDHSEPPFY